MRFNQEASDIADAAQYLTERAIQLLKFGVRLEGLEVFESEAVVAHFNTREVTPNDVGLRSGTPLHGDFVGIYLLAKHRGQNRFPKILRALDRPLLVHEDDGLVPYLEYRHFPYLMFGERGEYKQAEEFHGDAIDDDSKASLMQRVDYGMAALRYVPLQGNREAAKGGMALLPLIWSASDFAANWGKLPHRASSMLAIEFRTVLRTALETLAPFLPTSKRITASSIPVSCLAEVNDMLVAYATQTRYHITCWQTSATPYLEKSFRLWMERLSVSEADFATWSDRLHQPRKVFGDFVYQYHK